MNLASYDLFHILAAIASLLAVAHAGGLVAIKFRLPPMVGELVGGLLIGATVFARVLPDAFGWLFPVVGADGVVPPVLPVLGFCSQLGLLLLMFIGGLQMRRLVTRTDVRAVSWIAGLGVCIPVFAGLVIIQLADFADYLGPARSLPALHIILITALAVTSIPVITRIFMDLD